MTVTVEVGETGQNQIDSHKIIAYGQNVWVASSRASMLMSCVMPATNPAAKKGTSWTDDGYSRADAPENVTNEFEAQNSKRLNRGRRVGTWDHKFFSHMVGKKEMAEQLTDPTNPTVMAQAEAAGLFYDQRILGLITGGATEAVNDNPLDPLNPVLHSFQTVAFPTGRTIAVDDWDYYRGLADGQAAAPTGPSGLTLPKIRKAKTLLANRRFRGEICMAVSDNDVEHLKTSIEGSSRDYERLEELSTEDMFKFHGIKFIKVHPDAQVGYGTATAQCPVWVKDSIIFDRRNLVDARVHERADMHYNYEAYWRFQTTGLRRDDLSVANILCDQTAV